MGHQEGSRTSPQPQGSQKAEPQGTLPLAEPSTPWVPRRKPTTTHCSPWSPLHPAVKDLDGRVEKCHPAQNPEWGWGEGGKLQSCSCNMLTKIKHP